MDVGSVRSKLLNFTGKYKYVLLVVIIGIVLLLIPIDKQESKVTASSATVKTTPQNVINQELTSLLSKVKGAGKVEVYLMVREGEETIYQTNDDFTEDNSGNDRRNQTVIVTDSDRNEQGLVKKVNPPKYNGAIILCEGADNAQVQLQLIRAVANLTGLGTNKITVLKMK